MKHSQQLQIISHKEEQKHIQSDFSMVPNKQTYMLLADISLDLLVWLLEKNIFSQMVVSLMVIQVGYESVGPWGSSYNL